MCIADRNIPVYRQRIYLYVFRLTYGSESECAIRPTPQRRSTEGEVHESIAYDI